MMQNFILPSKLMSFLGSERREFVVRAERSTSKVIAVFLTGFAIFWLLVTSVATLPIVIPLFMGEEVNIVINDVPTVVNRHDLLPALGPLTIGGIFYLFGFFLLYGAIRIFTDKGAIFVGTPQRLVQYWHNHTISFDWSGFSGTMHVRGDAESGDLILLFDQARIENDRRSTTTVVLNAIPNVYEIQRICKQLIENSPKSQPQR